MTYKVSPQVNSPYPPGGLYAALDSGSVIIGGKKYKTKSIDGLIWTIENLALVTTNSVGRANHDEFGQYYPTGDLVEVRAALNDGWRIPSKTDFEKLRSAFPSTLDYQSTGYESWPYATNKSKFSAVPSRVSSSSDSQLDRAILWTSTEDYYEDAWQCFILGPDYTDFYVYPLTAKVLPCVRVCKTQNPKNLFIPESSSILKGFCGTVGNDFIVDANNGSQNTLVIPITEDMRGKYLRVSCNEGSDVYNRWIVGQVNDIPTSGRQTYGSDNILVITASKISATRPYSDTLRPIGNYIYLLFFFSSGISDPSKFINSLMICDDGYYYPYRR